MNYPTALSVYKVADEKLNEEMRQFEARCSHAWFLDNAQLLTEAARRNPFQSQISHGQLVSLSMYIHMLFQYQEHLSNLLKEIKALLKSFEEYRLIQSVPGIGDKIATITLSEIDDTNQFNNPKKVLAYTGLDPSVFESGKFKASINRMTKRGSSRLRQTLYTAVQCSLAKGRNKRLIAFYERKRHEGKLHKAVLIPCANKLVNWLYAVLKRQKVFVDQV